MKGKILFGTLLSIMLLLSLSWIAPAQVKAAELQPINSAKEISDEIGRKLATNPAMKDIISLNEPAKDIFLNVLKADSKEEIDGYVDDYFEVVNKQELADKLNTIASDLGQNYEQLYVSIDEERKINEDETVTLPDESYVYYIIKYTDEDGIKITKEYNYVACEDAMIFRSDGAIQYPSSDEWITLDQIENIRYYTLSIIGEIGVYLIMPLVIYANAVFPILLAIGALISAIGQELGIEVMINLGNFILNFSFTLFMFFAMLAVIGALLVIIDGLVSQSSDDSDSTLRVNLKLKQFLSKITGFNLIRNIVLRLPNFNLKAIFC